jgi:hypothetical protein
MKPKIDPTLVIVLYSCTTGLGLLVGLVPLLSVLGAPIAILAIVFGSILHYKLWDALPTSSRATSPGKAVGFLFIPFFNLYWYFVSYAALPTSIQKATGKPSANGLGVTFAIMSVGQWFFSWIPYVGVLYGIGFYVVWLLYYRAVTRDVNRYLDGGIEIIPPLPKYRN